MDIKEKYVYETLPLMANVYLQIKNLSLEEARNLLKKSFDENWVNKTVNSIGKEVLKQKRPSWYQAFFIGDEGDIGNDPMSDYVKKYMPQKQAIMEIAMYIALKETNVYEPMLNTQIDFDSLNRKVSIDGRVKDVMSKITDYLPDSNVTDVTVEDYYKMIGKVREKLMNFAFYVKEKLEEKGYTTKNISIKELERR